MKARIAISIIMILASASPGFTQTVEKKEKINTPTKLGSTRPSSIKPEYSYRKPLPFLYSYPAMTRSTPTRTDVYRSQQNPVYRQLSFAGNRKQMFYPGMGKYISIHGAIRWQPTQKLFIETGGLFSKQFYYSASLFWQNITGVNGKIQYTPANRIRFNIRGPSIFAWAPSLHSVYNSLFPHTGTGASLSINVKKDTDISVGAEYQFDNKSQKWKVETSGRVSIGF